MPKTKPEKQSGTPEEKLEKLEAVLRQKVTEQLLAITGQPADFDRLTLSFIRPGLRQCRANYICRKPLKGELISGSTPRIKYSYFLMLTPLGEIIDSNPPLKSLV